MTRSKSGRSETLLQDLISAKGGMEVMNGIQGQGSQRMVRDGGIRDLVTINKGAKEAHLLTVALPEKMRQKLARGGSAKDKIRTRHIPVLMVFNIRWQKQEKVSYKHHSIREIGGYLLPRSFLFPKNEAERSESAKEYANNVDEGIKKQRRIERMSLTGAEE